jgi:hypothetical protein
MLLQLDQEAIGSTTPKAIAPIQFSPINPSSTASRL